MRLSNRSPGLAVPCPVELRASPFAHRGRELVVLSYPLAPPPIPASLTRAERAVARAILTGATNAEIAAARAVSVRTIANQVAAIFRKLDVGSRAELIARLHRQARV